MKCHIIEKLESGSFQSHALFLQGMPQLLRNALFHCLNMSRRDENVSSRLYCLFPWGVVYHTVTKFFCLNSGFQKTSQNFYHAQFINHTTIHTTHESLIDSLKVAIELIKY